MTEAHGKWVYPPTLSRADDFSSGFAVASAQSGLLGAIDASGMWMIPETYHKCRSFSCGLAYAATDGFSGFIDMCNRRVIKLKSDWECFSFSEGLAATMLIEIGHGKEPRMGYVNLQGDLAIPFSFESASSFNNGHAVVQVDGKWGIIDRTGHFVVSPRYDDALFGFREGFAPVKEKGVYFYVDPSGMPAFGGKTFAAAGPFANGIARVGIETS